MLILNEAQILEASSVNHIGTHPRRRMNVALEGLKDKHVISNICAYLKLFVNAVIKAVVLFVIFALVQRVVLHMLGQRCLHLVDVYA